MNNRFMRSCLGLGVLALTLGASPARATALYDVLTSGTLTIEAITGGDLSELLIEGQSSVFDTDALESGEALAEADGVTLPEELTEFGVGDSIDVLALASGEAGPGAGSADSFFFGDGFLDIFNQSTSATFTIDFLFDYTLSALALVDDPVAEFAFGLSALSLIADSVDDVLVDEIVEANTDFALSGGTVSDVLSFSLMVAPGESDLLTLTADADGSAVSEGVAAVPAPSALALMALGLVMMLRRARA